MDWSPAIRLRRTNIQQYAESRNLLTKAVTYRNYAHSNLSDFSKHLSDFDIVLFGGQSEYDFLLMRKLKELNPKIILLRDHCEDIWGLPWEHECFQEAHAVVCSSYTLAKKSADMGYKPFVIEEHYEPVDYTPAWQKPLVAGYMGGDYDLAESFRLLAESLGYTYIHVAAPVTPLPPGSKALHWSKDSWAKLYSSFRVALLPQRPELPAKSPVKVIQALGNNIPPICSPLDSYKRIVKQGETGFICESGEQWKNALTLMADNDVCRSVCEKISDKKFSASFSLHSITKKWLDYFFSLKISQGFKP